MIFLLRMYSNYSNSEGIPIRGSLPPSTLIFTTIFFRVCIDGRSVPARLGLTIRGLPTINERAIRNIDDHSEDFTYNL